MQQTCVFVTNIVCSRRDCDYWLRLLTVWSILTGGNYLNIWQVSAGPPTSDSCHYIDRWSVRRWTSLWLRPFTTLQCYFGHLLALDLLARSVMSLLGVLCRCPVFLFDGVEPTIDVVRRPHVSASTFLAHVIASQRRRTGMSHRSCLCCSSSPS